MFNQIFFLYYANKINMYVKSLVLYSIVNNKIVTPIQFCEKYKKITSNIYSICSSANMQIYYMFFNVILTGMIDLLSTYVVIVYMLLLMKTTLIPFCMI